MVDFDRIAKHAEEKYQEALQIGEGKLKKSIQHLEDLFKSGDEKLLQELLLDPTWDYAYSEVRWQLELLKEGKDKTLEERHAFWKNKAIDQYKREQDEILENAKTRRYNF